MTPQSQILPRLRLMLGSTGLLGPGKAELLQAVERTGSISAAARSMDMSYKRAWTLVDELNRSFRCKVVSTNFGGANGGGARLTEFGHELAQRYRTMIAAASEALSADLTWLEDNLDADGHAADGHDDGAAGTGAAGK